MDWFRNQKLSFRLLLLTAAVSIVIVMINAVLFEWFYLKQDHLKFQKHLEHEVKVFSPSILEAHNKQDIEQLEETLSLLFELSEARTMRVIENDKTRFAFGDTKPSSDSDHIKVPYTLAQDANTTELIFTVDKPKINVNLENATLIKISSGVVQTLALCLCIFYFSRRLVFRHLRQISDFAEKLSVKNLSQKLFLDRSTRRSRNDELDTLAKSIETMRVQLIEDFDNRKSMELALLREKEENIEAKKLIEDTRAADRAKSRFIATMSHEIRTPMNGIIGMVQMLQGTSVNDEQKNYLDIITRSSNALMHIINDILDFSRIESGKVPLDVESISLRKQLKESVQLFIGVANSRNISLVANVHPDVPDNMRADPKRLLQVISNLIGNAFKFTETGSITLDVQVQSKNDNIYTLEFRVTDTGIGISEEAQKDVFRPYTQADDSMTRKYGGTGLGLAICKQIVSAMGGEIGLESQKNVGSQFWFTGKFAVEAQQSKPHENTPERKQTILYLDNDGHSKRYFVDHAKTKNKNVISFGTLAKASEFLNGSHDNIESIDKCILNNEASIAELSVFIDALKSKNISDIYILATGNHYKALLSDEGLRNYARQRPLFISEFLSPPEKAELEPKKTNHSNNPDEGLIRRNLKVLVAEDNAVNQIVIRGLLKKFEIDAEFASNGQETIDAHCTETPFDLIFMDCEMPVMDGFDATRNIRIWEEKGQRSATPIIALTAHVESSYKTRCFESGMDFYLSKPITAEKIGEAFKKMQLA